MHAAAPLLSALLLPSVALAAPQAGVARATVAQAGSEEGRAARIEERLSELEARNAALEARLEEVSTELRGSLLAGFYTPVGDSHHGLAPGASKVYSSENPLTFGGFGEALWNGVQGEGDTVGVARAVLYLGYRFDERWVFNSGFRLLETATEDANPDLDTGDVDFAYLEYTGSDALAVRMGLLLMPMGFVNEQFEPPQIYSADRPELERRILPSTWSEAGLGLSSAGERVSWRAYLVNGFDASGFGPSGLAGGRQGASGALAEDLALVGRLDWHGAEGLLLGTSAYHGNAGQGLDGAGSVSTTIAELHAEYERGGFRGRALGVVAEIDDLDRLNAVTGLANDASAGSRLRGYYLEAGYDLLHGRSESTAVIPFVRYELLDTQSQTPDGFTRDGTNDLESWTFGVAVKPLPNLILRVDYVDNEAEGGYVADALRLSFGYVF